MPIKQHGFDRAGASSGNPNFYVKSKEAKLEDDRKYPAKPSHGISVPGKKMVVCYICGREFGSKSVGIHEPQCLKKWKVQNAQLAPQFRRPEPIKPVLRDAPGGSQKGADGTPIKGAIGGYSASQVDSSYLTANLIQCPTCTRSFNPDRIEIHTRICQKTAAKPAKVFDSFKKRNEGTDNEPYAQRSLTRRRPSKPNNWRKNHEDFLNAVRGAKQVQQHLNRGGNIRDLPPPPPSYNPDYVQCPRCNRRFNQKAAERHIPVCNNKPVAFPSYEEKTMMSSTKPTKTQASTSLRGSSRAASSGFGQSPGVGRGLGRQGSAFGQRSDFDYGPGTSHGQRSGSKIPVAKSSKAWGSTPPTPSPHGNNRSNTSVKGAKSGKYANQSPYGGRELDDDDGAQSAVTFSFNDVPFQSRGEPSSGNNARFKGKGEGRGGSKGGNRDRSITTASDKDASINYYEDDQMNAGTASGNDMPFRPQGIGAKRGVGRANAGGRDVSPGRESVLSPIGRKASPGAAKGNSAAFLKPRGR